MAPASTRYERFCLWTRRWVYVTHQATWGLLLCVMSGPELQSHLPSGTPLQKVFHTAMMLAATWCLISLALQPFAGFLDYSGAAIEWNRRTWVQILMFAALIIAVSESERIWAPPATALALFGLVWVRSTPKERRIPIALAGWLWAGIYPLTVSLPNPQRMWLGLFIGGAATAVQGVVAIARHFLVDAGGTASGPVPITGTQP